MAQATAMTAFGFVLPFLALYLKELHVESERAVVLWSGALVSGTAIALALASPVWGVLADRYGRRVMVLRSMLVGGVLIALMSLAQNVEQFLVLRILQGALTGTVAASTALVATIVPRDRLASSMGLLQTSAYLGIAGGPTLGGLVAEAVGIRGTFVVAGALLGGGGAAVWLFVHEHYQPATERRPGFIRSLQVGLSSPAVRPLLVVLFLIQVSSAIVFPILPLVVQHLAVPGDPVKLYAGLAFGVTAMFSAIAAVAYSRVADRSGYRRILIYCCFGAAAFFLPQALAANVGQLLLLRAGLGIFFGALIPATNAIVAMVSPRQSHGSVFGLASSVTALGTAIGPLVGSGIAASFGLSSIFFATAAVLGLLGLWVTVTVREPAPVD